MTLDDKYIFFGEVNMDNPKMVFLWLMAEQVKLSKSLLVKKEERYKITEKFIFFKLIFGIH